jgi:sugar-phosphatase
MERKTMAYSRPIAAAIFDMDGLLIDSEPLWTQAELDVFGDLGLDLSQRHLLPDTLGLRIDQVVRMWYQAMPWQGPTQEEVTQRVIARAIELVEQTRPLLPGVTHALELCRAQGLKIGLASASPLHMLDKVLEMFNLTGYFQIRASAEHLPYSKPHPEVYIQAASQLQVDPLNCVTLEDSFNGMIATKAARMRSIVVPDHAFSEDPRWALADVKLSSLEQLRAEHIR